VPSSDATWHRDPLRLALVAALLVAGLGVSIARAADGSAFAPGLVVLLVVAAAVVAVRARWVPIVAVAAVVLVLANRLSDGWDGGVAAVLGAALVLGGAVVALGASVGLLVADPPPLRSIRVALPARRPRTHVWLALGLMVLSAVCAEDLAAYDDTTGRPAELLAGLLIFVFLYGGPALLIREFVRRTERGWTSFLLLATAAGIVQAGLVDQSLFNDDYREIESWGDLYDPTSVDALGLSAYAAQSFVLGHAIYSFGAPVALLEAAVPGRSRSPWLGTRGIVVVAIGYLAVAALVLVDTLSNEPTRPTVAQLVGAVVVVTALVAAALRVPRHVPPSSRRAPHVAIVVAVSFVLATLLAFAPSTWAGFAASAAIVVVSVALLAYAAGGAAWGVRHAGAVAAGAVLSRGLLAFTYYPVIGDVSAAQKYAHNVVMLAVVSVVVVLALRAPDARG